VLSNLHEPVTFPALTYSQLARVVVPVVRALYRLEVSGSERMPEGGPVLVVANHESVLDPFVLASALQRELRFLAKAELWRYRPVAWLMDSLGGIRVERGRGDLAALSAAGAALEAGGAVAVFPQGVVRSSGPWHRGAAKLALATGAPILPVRLIGTERALSRGRVGLPRLRVVVGEPIWSVRGPATIAAARQLTAEIRAAVEALSWAETAGR
jgi:1-acyl-sn-glycerol-3-phosphate acyltransferase